MSLLLPRQRRVPDLHGAALLRLCRDVADRTPLSCRSRHAAAYLGHIVFGLDISRLSRLTGRDRATVRYACKRLEDLRDEPTSDLSLDAAETALRLFSCSFLGLPVARGRA